MKFKMLEEGIPAVQDFLEFDKHGIYYQDFVGYLQYPFSSKHFNINSHGFRCPEFTMKKMDERYRILMLGSSALLGVPNCSDNETISYYLQESFINNGQAVEVLNLGVRSYVIMNELNLLYRINLDMDFDAIIIFDGYNDIFCARHGNVFDGYRNIANYLKEAWDSRLYGDRKWFLSQAKGLKKRRISNFFSHSKILQNKLRGFLPTGSKKTVQQAPPQYDASRKFYLQHAEHFINFAKANNKQILFCHQPSLYTTKKSLHTNEKLYYDYSVPIFFDKQNLSFDQFRSKYEEQIEGLYDLCSKHDVASLNLPGLTNNPDSTEQVFHDYCHMTPYGNKLVAEHIYSTISSWM